MAGRAWEIAEGGTLVPWSSAGAKVVTMTVAALIHQCPVPTFTISSLPWH